MISTAREAASRGAGRVVAVERERAAVAALRRNRDLLGLSTVEIIAGDALAWLASEVNAFDVVFLDPPFASEPWPDLARLVLPRLKPNACVYCEASKALPTFATLRLQRQGRAGMVHYHLFVNDSAEAQPPAPIA
ncbi:MAG: RsmD family RNA methyltransferase [Casimicrobiaceae bacterium]